MREIGRQRELLLEDRRRYQFAFDLDKYDQALSSLNFWDNVPKNCWSIQNGLRCSGDEKYGISGFYTVLYLNLTKNYAHFLEK
jgi:hypothetical protein